MKLQKEDYVVRISNATPLQLVIISYELCLDFMACARDSFGTDAEQFEKNIKKAQEALAQLTSALDLQYDVTQNLLTLYIHVNQLLNTAYFSRDMQSLAEAEKIMSALLSSWKELERSQPAGVPVMENAQRVYAGLTYTNGGLDEYIEDDGKRGFKA